jgi:acetate kinase
MNILVLNCGSSSLKFQLINMKNDRVRLKGLVEKIGSSRAMLTFNGEKNRRPIRDVLEIPDHDKAVRLIMSILTHPDHGVISSTDDISGVGHRTVHGGEEFSKSAIITPEVIEAMERCIPFAPLHNPANITGIQIARKIMPQTPQVGVFDTAFHSKMPMSSFLYGLPYELYERDGIRRYGFHGTSHKYVAQQAAEYLQKPLESLKIISCHLGNGSSIAAINNGHSIDTSMGFTPLEGLVMGTRCGDLDPAIVSFIQEQEGLSHNQVDSLMNKRSGLLGISGVSNDMRELEEEAVRGNQRAQLAIEIFGNRVRKYIGAYTAVLGGCDTIVFTGGIGENASKVRYNVLDELGYMGVKLDVEANSASEVLISKGRVKVLVIPTNEELAIARETAQILSEMKQVRANTDKKSLEDELKNLSLKDRRELVLLWADSGNQTANLDVLRSRFNHRVEAQLSTAAIRMQLQVMGLLEA